VRFFQDETERTLLGRLECLAANGAMPHVLLVY
jgi:hypothetical protein